MNLNLALCLIAPPSTAAEVRGALVHLETMWFCHLPQAASLLGHGEQPALSQEVCGCRV